MKRNANFVTAADAFGDWKENLLTGEPPTLFPVAGSGELARIEIGPGLVTLIGGAPGSGKTAFTMQLVVDALRLTESLRVLVCNIEMPPSILLDRLLDAGAVHPIAERGGRFGVDDVTVLDHADHIFRQIDLDMRGAEIFGHPAPLLHVGEEHHFGDLAAAIAVQGAAQRVGNRRGGR